MVLEENRVEDEGNSKVVNEENIKAPKDNGLWRDLTAYWILGLCNNYGYVIMLSAAYDIIARFGIHGEPTQPIEPAPETGRMCNIISTGAILLADVIPSLTVKIIAPFLPFYINVRIFVAILLQLAGFLLVAYAESEWVALLGVVLTSLSSGLGEASFLAYTSYFNKNVVSTWSSRTGGAGIIGSLSYAALISLGVSPIHTMLIMLSVPILEGVAFWFVLRKPMTQAKITEVETVGDSTNTISTTSTLDDIKEFDNLDVLEERNELSEDEKPLVGLKNKVIYVGSLMKYILPLTMVYLVEYFINQGLGEPTQPIEPAPETGRMCNIISTGAILLADVIPSLTVKIIAPFLPFYINVRIFVAILLQLAGFLLVAYAESEWVALLGVVLTSLSSGLGEASFLAYTSYFNKNVVSTWSSRTGGAGIIGSLSYAALISLGVSPIHTMLIMLSVPILEGVAFWFVLRKPMTQANITEVETVGDSTNTISTTSTLDDIKEFDNLDVLEERNELSEDEKPLVGLKNKVIYVGSLMKYILPLTMVYLVEYFINQGLFELVYFPNIWLDKESQYRWLQVDYQIGVFISRSSVNFVTIEKIWLMAVFQFFNVVIFLFEVIYFFMPSIWIIFTLVLWEGLLGGGAYVNTFYRMSKEVPPARRKFALGVVPLGDSFGIALAGALAIPVHNALCLLPVPR